MRWWTNNGKKKPNPSSQFCTYNLPPRVSRQRLLLELRYLIEVMEEVEETQSIDLIEYDNNALQYNKQNQKIITKNYN